MALLGYFLEPVISRDGCLYLELVRIWHETGSFKGLLEVYPDCWIPPFPLFLMKILVDLGLSPEVAGVGLNMVMFSCLPLITWLICGLLFPEEPWISR